MGHLRSGLFIIWLIINGLQNEILEIAGHLEYTRYISIGKRIPVK